MVSAAKVVGNAPRLPGSFDKAVAEDCRDRRHQRGPDRLVVVGAHAVADIPRPERVGVTKQLIQPENGLDDDF